MTKISVCIIAKNEEKTIERCLASLVPYQFEIIVVDTGSTDRTKEIAKRFTDHIYDFTWCDDFGAARNFSIDKASNEWIFCIDCDEYIISYDTELIRSLLLNYELSLGYIIQRNVMHAESEQGVSYINGPIARVFNRKYYRFSGAIHEQLVPIDPDAKEARFDTGIVVLHSGYDLQDEMMNQKQWRNITLLEKNLNSCSLVEKPYYYFQLGKSYSSLKTDSAEQMKKNEQKAYEYYKEALSYPINPEEIYYKMLVVKYGYALYDRKQSKEAISYLECCNSVLFKNADFVFVLGILYSSVGRYEESIDAFQKALYLEEAYTEGTNGYLCHYNLGRIFERFGKWKKAADSYSRCIDYYDAEKRCEEVIQKEEKQTPFSIVMIGKNEEQYIDECLSRLVLLNGEIIFVDTGSEDNTVRIASRYTDNIYFFEWCDDFSAARNFAVSKASNDVILSVDCDEYLDVSGWKRETLLDLVLEFHSSQIGMIQVYNPYKEGEKTVSIATERIGRLFNRRYIRYEGSIHEQLNSIFGSELTFLSIPFHFYHAGYESDTIRRQKAMRNIPLLEEALKKDPSDPYLYFQLGQTYFGMDDYENALLYFEKGLGFDVNEREDYVQTMVESYGYSLLNLQRYEEALQLEGIYDTFCKRADFVFLMGLIYMNNALFTEAVEQFQKATSMEECMIDGVNSYKADYNIGVILECLNETEAAIVSYKKCENYPPAMERIKYLEKILPDTLQSILIYKTNDTCYNILNVFAEQLADALLACGQRVEIFDVQKEGNSALTQFIGRKFKAIIGIQTYVFSIMMQDNMTNLHDLIEGPKYNMILDHPAWLKEHFANAPKNYHLLIHDRNYLAFADRYFTNIGRNYHFSPAGIQADRIISDQKKYDISFIGTYHDYRERLNIIRTYGRPQRFLINRYMTKMKHSPNMPAEEAFLQVLDDYGLQVSDMDFLDLFYESRQVCFAIMCYYREKIVSTLLNNGIQIHVFGESWEKAPFSRHKNLVRHSSLTPEESLGVMSLSKISLNIMSWHKDGFTERIANAMLASSVVLSDRSTYLSEEFEEGEEIVLFDLEKIDELPELVRQLLKDNGKLKRIAAAGYEKAGQRHLWIHRGEGMLNIIAENEAEGRNHRR